MTSHSKAIVIDYIDGANTRTHSSGPRLVQFELGDSVGHCFLRAGHRRRFRFWTQHVAAFLGRVRRGTSVPATHASWHLGLTAAKPAVRERSRTCRLLSTAKCRLSTRRHSSRPSKAERSLATRRYRRRPVRRASFEGCRARRSGPAKLQTLIRDCHCAVRLYFISTA